MKSGWLCAVVALASTPAFAQRGPSYYDEPVEVVEPAGTPVGPSANASTYTVSHGGEYANARAALGIGFVMPGAIGFQASFQSFGAFVDGLYLDLRMTGTQLGGEMFGSKSPLFEDSFELDMRVGFGTRDYEPRQVTIRDSSGRRTRGRVPDAFGVAPFIGYRGRWGYDMQAVRLGLHVARSVDAEVVFGDGRVGQAFSDWAFDFELFYALRNEEQQKLGVAFGIDYFFNSFVFFRSELGYASPHQDNLRDAGYTGVNSLDGFFWKAMLGFAYQFSLPTSADRAQRAPVETATQRVDEPLVPAPAPARNTAPAAATPAAAPAAATPAETTPTPQASTPDPAPLRNAECSSSAQCDDGVFCNGIETCSGGVCLPGSLEDDAISCTRMICDEENETISFIPMHGLCGDGLFCNGSERCDVNEGCIPGTPPPIDDQNECTIDSCDESLDRLINEPIPGCGVTETPASAPIREPAPLVSPDEGLSAPIGQ